ncbi:MAG TPA: hypothetical protein VGZ73_21570 [Bryobacteraceae bacterium]|nr:hypothetical protein [Bryobacteraceae bacterium]
MSTFRRLFLLLAVMLVASRLCHVAILWEGDTLPLAAAEQMLHGKVIYRDIWFDKPPLLPAVYLLWGARPGWALRLGDALYALLACWIAYRFARDLWSEREGIWAAGLLGFFLIFDFPSAVIPVASDLMMLAPHLAAVWMASKRRPFWAGALAGVAFWISPKGLFVAAACLLWDPAGAIWMATGFVSVSGVAVVWLWTFGALEAYWEEVWKWGRLYAGSPFVEDPIKNGVVRTLNWVGFHAAIVVAAGRFLLSAKPSLSAGTVSTCRSLSASPPLSVDPPLWGGPPGPRRTPWSGRVGHVRWYGWLLISLIGLAAGLRFFPRYYFLLLPVVVLMAARGFTLLGRKRELVALLLLIPATRFGPAYVSALTNHDWRDINMDRDSRAAADFTRDLAKPGDTLFVWGYRPEMYAYTGIPAATLFLDSQPLTGVPADRHLTQSEPVETVWASRRRAELARSKPTFVLDGLGLYNPQLAITNYPDLHEWMSHYREVGRRGQTIIYVRVGEAR